MDRDPGIKLNPGATHTPYTRQTHAAVSTNARRNTSAIVYPKPTLLTLMVIFTLTLLAFFISLSMQMMNQLFLGQSMCVAIAAVILPLVLSLILSLIACQQYGQSRWIVVPTTLLLTLALTLFLAASLYCY